MNASNNRPRAQALSLLQGQEDWLRRFERVKDFSSTVRTSEYHLTNACNIRCKGCWYFEYGHDKSSREKSSLAAWKNFIQKERSRGVNSALLIGGEPTLFRDRIAAFAAQMDSLSISTNGLIKLPYTEQFSAVTVFISVFGGGPMDDELRAIKPNGKSFTGLFDTALSNYKGDPRATFVYAVTEGGIDYVEETVRRIQDNGNRVTFNFYSQYGSDHPLKLDNGRRLMDLLMDVKQRYPETVTNHREHIRAIITGQSWLGRFGYDVCPSVSNDHPDNAERMVNGNPVLPGFNTYKPDQESLEMCCTSGHCEDCRDSQAVYSWLLVGLKHSLNCDSALKTWIEVAESYWSQFIWSPYCQASERLAPAKILVTTT